MTRTSRCSRLLVAARHVGTVSLVGAVAVLAACAAPAGDGAATSAPAAATSAPPAATSAPPAPATTASVAPTVARTPAAMPTPTPAPTHRPKYVVRYVTHVPLPHGCLTVGPAIVGIKVYLVQRALHLVGHKERYDSATVAAVKAFQTAHALRVTGLVDATTWVALHTGYDFCVDRYTQQPTVLATASQAQRIEAMIAYAGARVGLPYVWGGAGPMGFDCSGLDLQALYAGGVVVPGINTDLHVQASFTTTKMLYASALPHVPFSQRRRGDLVFYGSPISHMAIYLGNGRILEAVRPFVRTAALLADGLPAQPYVLRPFPG